MTVLLHIMAVLGIILLLCLIVVAYFVILKLRRDTIWLNLRNYGSLPSDVKQILSQLVAAYADYWQVKLYMRHLPGAKKLLEPLRKTTKQVYESLLETEGEKGCQPMKPGKSETKTPKQP